MKTDPPIKPATDRQSEGAGAPGILSDLRNLSMSAPGQGDIRCDRAGRRYAVSRDKPPEAVHLLDLRGAVGPDLP
jgi:hypothetical protein